MLNPPGLLENSFNALKQIQLKKKENRMSFLFFCFCFFFTATFSNFFSADKIKLNKILS